MLRIVGVVAFVVAVTADYDYSDPSAKETAERIKNMPTTLNRLLSMEKYSPDADLTTALAKYKKIAAKVKDTSCAVDEAKFDYSFDQLVKNCVPKAASEESKKKLAKAISDGLKETQVVDESIKLSAKLFGSTSDDNASSPAKIAQTKAQESLKTVMEKATEALQECFHATKSSMDACVKTESKKLWGEIIDAAKSIPSSC